MIHEMTMKKTTFMRPEVAGTVFALTIGTMCGRSSHLTGDDGLPSLSSVSVAHSGEGEFRTNRPRLSHSSESARHSPVKALWLGSKIRRTAKLRVFLKWSHRTQSYKFNPSLTALWWCQSLARTKREDDGNHLYWDNTFKQLLTKNGRALLIQNAWSFQISWKWKSKRKNDSFESKSRFKLFSLFCWQKL